MKNKDKIGVLGGSFNPPHLGHTEAARNAMHQIGLSKVIFIPSNLPPHKDMADNAPDAAIRLEMTGIAVRNDPFFEVSDIEIARGGVSFSVNTLEELKRQYPDMSLYFIMGSDMFLSFESWYRFQKIAELCTLTVVPRHQKDIEMLSAHQKRLSDKFGIASEIINTPAIEISSTQLRSAIAKGAAAEWIDGEVLSYIKRNRLYC